MNGCGAFCDQQAPLRADVPTPGQKVKQDESQQEDIGPSAAGQVAVGAVFSDKKEKEADEDRIHPEAPGG